MPQLTAEQKNSVAQWVAEGATLNDVQSRLKDELGVTLTYFDTRLLIMELGLSIQDKKREEPTKTEPESAENAQGADPTGDYPDYADDAAAGSVDDWSPPEPPAGGGKVTVSLDEIAIPGAMVSGKAIFSDGKSVRWILDQYGRLSLRDAEPGYQPPAADLPVFQRELQRLLR